MKLLLKYFAVTTLATLVLALDPSDYGRARNIICPAIDRTDPDKPLNTEIRIHYIESQPPIKPKRTLVFVHGWPGLWSVWARQIEHFADQYRILVPNLRGFGHSGYPGNGLKSYAGQYNDFVSDLTCMLDAAGVEEATCIGHDWGSQLCFEAARQRPDRFTTVVGAVVPYLPSAGPFVKTKELASLAPTLSYQVYLSHLPDDATAELDKDIRRTLRAIIRGTGNPPPKGFLANTNAFLDIYGEEEIPPIVFFSPDEEDFLVTEFKRKGFGPTFQFYQDENRLGSWKNANEQGNFTVTAPCLFIAPTRDPVMDWVLAMKLLKTAEFLSDVKVVEVETAHWPQLEKPKEFNSFIEEFFAEQDKKNEKGHDEL